MSRPPECQDARTPPPTTGTRWLDEEERAVWLMLADLLVRLPGAMDTQLQRDAGLSYFEYMVLAVLHEQPDRVLRMSTLAGLTNGSLSRLSHVARRLEHRRLLRREPCTEDGRSTNAFLTETGAAVVEAAAPGHVAAVRSWVFDGLTPAENRQLGSMIDRIQRRIPGPMNGPSNHGVCRDIPGT